VPGGQRHKATYSPASKEIPNPDYPALPAMLEESGGVFLILVRADNQRGNLVVTIFEVDPGSL